LPRLFFDFVQVNFFHGCKITADGRGVRREGFKISPCPLGLKIHSSPSK
jgi:hypothetical protein